MRDVVVRYRRMLVIAVHIGLWTLAYACAFMLRFELEIPRPYFRDAPILLGTLLAIRTAVYWRLGLFHALWRYSGALEAISEIRPALASLDPAAARALDRELPAGARAVVSHPSALAM